MFIGAGQTKVTQDMSIKMQWSLFRFAVKHEYVSVWPAFWECCRDHFETRTIQQWNSVKIRTARLTFIHRFLPELQQFMSAEHLNPIVESLEQEKVLPGLALAAVLKCRIGHALFSSEADQARWQLFIAGCKQKLDDLLHNNFTIEETGNYRKACKAEVGILLDSGFEAPDKIELEVSYFGEAWLLEASCNA